jgi:hypothetical protein
MIIYMPLDQGIYQKWSRARQAHDAKRTVTNRRSLVSSICRDSGRSWANILAVDGECSVHGGPTTAPASEGMAVLF